MLSPASTRGGDHLEGAPSDGSQADDASGVGTGPHRDETRGVAIHRDS